MSQEESTQQTKKPLNKKVVIIAAVLSLLLVGSAAAAVYIYVAGNQGATTTTQNPPSANDIKKTDQTLNKKVTADYSSGEAVIRTYYKALATKDYETAFSCFSEKTIKDNNYTLESLKKGWDNYKKIGIKSLTTRYQAASARIYEALVIEDVEYYDDSIIAGNPDTRFVSTLDEKYDGKWKISQIATSPINL